MRAVLQRVTYSSVKVDDKITGKISKGLLILLGIVPEDSITDIDWLVRKISNMRIFNDDNGIMNKSLIDVKGEALIISQFTLHASTKKGNRPSYIKAAKPDLAVPLYDKFVDTFQNATQLKTETGIFGADMQVELLNDGPVTIIIDSKLKE